ncbi:MAG: DUF1214 domain-containing protein [bacterium]|nr:hypothetical protein [Deltaproteobacteria bacterium]MCP4906126.1 DUF1214 domain-containing protein [bacterium]
MIGRVMWVALVGSSVWILGCESGKPEATDLPALVAKDENPYRALQSVQAFERLQATLEALKETVLEDAETEREASEGMRAILRVLSMSSDVTGDANPKAPHFARMDTKIRKVGGDNPDAEYDNIGLDHRWDYVIRGNVGSVSHVSFTITGSRAASGRAPMIGYFNERTLAPDERGDFEIHLTKKDDGGPNWVDTSSGISSILIRQYIGDRGSETLATYEIAVVGRLPDSEIPYSTDAEVARGIAGTVYSTQYMMTMHRTIMPELFDHPNRFSRLNSDDFGADISGTDNLYMLATFQIEEDEALLIETVPLDVRYWNIAIESRWHESVDYLTRRTHRSLSDAVVDVDGKLRFVLAHGKTPHPNWLDTGGHNEGFMTFRWVGERETEAPVPTVIRMKRSEVPAALADRIAAR